MFHQAAFPPGRIARMNSAFLCGDIQRADGSHHGSRCILSAFKGSACIFYGSASRAAKVAVAQTPLLVLAVAFDLRLDISQSVSSNKMNLPSEAVLYMIELVLSRKKLGFDEKPSFVIYGV